MRYDVEDRFDFSESSWYNKISKLSLSSGNLNYEDVEQVSRVFSVMNAKWSEDRGNCLTILIKNELFVYFNLNYSCY